MAQSFKIDGQAFYVRDFSTPRIIPAIKWIQDAALAWHGSDRGAAQDIYEVDVVFYDQESAINILQQKLEAFRKGITLDNFGTEIFAPTVDHSSSISCAVVKLGPRKYDSFASPQTGMWEFPVTFRAIAPTLLTPMPSLSTLRIQPGYEADKSYGSTKLFSYTQVAEYQDRRDDYGTFKGTFRQIKTEAMAIIAYALVTARATEIVFPTLANVTYPFGIIRGAGPFDSKILQMTIKRVNFVFWDIGFIFAEAP